jgi:tartrate dehydrogenase/decarboxylase/D-malate dehydrogenase
MPGVPSPLAGRRVGDIDFNVVRENTEGEYSSIGGRIFVGHRPPPRPMWAPQ